MYQIATHQKGTAHTTNNKLKILFDVDGVLIDHNDKWIYSNIDLLLSFVKLGCQVFVASGGGVDYASMWVRRLSLEDQVTVIEKGSMEMDVAFDDRDVKLGKVNIKV
jgi:hydroxymethylpyrimidine pyrophosphatase-like HAD family hydrolase